MTRARPKRQPKVIKPDRRRYSITMAMELLLSFRALPSPSTPPPKPKHATYWHPNGPRECERRSRQIAAGQLKKENGLCGSP